MILLVAVILSPSEPGGRSGLVIARFIFDTTVDVQFCYFVDHMSHKLEGSVWIQNLIGIFFNEASQVDFLHKFDKRLILASIEIE